MLVFNHDFDCFCTGSDKPVCHSRSACMLNHVETNFKHVKHRATKSEIELIKKNLKEGIKNSPLDLSAFHHRSETTASFKKFG